MSLSAAQEAIIADRLRIWHVRRACQVATLSASTTDPSDGTPKGDAALDALLRCLLYELSADIAAVTLLDQDTQYFLAVVPRSSLHTPDVTGDTRKWYGCQSISHGGGLCIRTITMPNDMSSEPVFEIFDLTDGHTKVLPVVDGTAASFRHYIGVPLTIRDGQRIGTIFVFRDKAAQEGLPRVNRHFIHETARQVVDQIYLNIEALESKRALRCNSAVLSLMHVSETRDSRSVPSKEKHAIVEDPRSGVYHHAAKLLAQAFEFEGVTIQELPSPIRDASSGQSPRSKVLGFHHRFEEPSQGQLPELTAERLMEAFPSGAVCHLLTESDGIGTFAASVPGNAEFSMSISLNVFEHRAAPEQFIFMPLLNTYHHRHTAFILGWAMESTRVYASATDLLPLSAFGMAIMTQVRRVEEQSLDRKKNDFLGSVSHEMRSPLHGVMACIDLAREPESHDHQLELLDCASSCALQLGDTIDNLLTSANIGSPSHSQDQSIQLRNRSQKIQPDQSPEEVPINLVTLIEEIFAKERSKSKSVTPASERRAGSLPVEDPTVQTTVVVDSPPFANVAIIPQSDVGIIVRNLVSNCLKFTGPTGCIRVSLEIDGDDVKLLFRDTAGGIPLDFVNHRLFVPFAQHDPLNPGMGLGLSLVHSAVQRLGGDISFHTDEAAGTDFLVSIPKNRFTHDLSTASVDGVQDSAEVTVDFSALNIQLLAPERWTIDGDDPVRNSHCLDSFATSLTRILSTWCLVDLQLCTGSQTIVRPSQDILILLHSDLEKLRLMVGDAFESTKMVVICPNEIAEKSVQSSAPTRCATISGPVVPRKVITALRTLSEMKQDQPMTLSEAAADSTEGPSIEGPNGMAQSHPVDDEITTDTIADPIRDEKVPMYQDLPRESDPPPKQPYSTTTYPEPKLLLVDDNAINLKVLEMFAKKCSKISAISASGGREAITKFQSARETHPDAQAFDIILLDLSMPEVSGFDVAVAVRQFEVDNMDQDFPRTYIVALTGLVSGKDRDAAFAAGVNEYVTKPASLKDLQKVVRNWRAIKTLV